MTYQAGNAHHLANIIKQLLTKLLSVLPIRSDVNTEVYLGLLRTAHNLKLQLELFYSPKHLNIKLTHLFSLTKGCSKNITLLKDI